jgi:hypothetical protein
MIASGIDVGHWFGFEGASGCGASMQKPVGGDSLMRLADFRATKLGYGFDSAVRSLELIEQEVGFKPFEFEGSYMRMSSASDSSASSAGASVGFLSRQLRSELFDSSVGGGCVSEDVVAASGCAAGLGSKAVTDKRVVGCVGLTLSAGC